MRLPTPKLGTASRPGRWYDFYAMFSESFGDAVVSAAGLSSSAVVLDPWVGAGTATSAACRAGFRSIGVDVNPVMVEVARGRGVSGQDAVAAVAACGQRLAPARRGVGESDPLSGWFAPAGAYRFRQWERAARGTEPVADSACVAFLLTGVFAAAKGMCRQFRSKNPTWFKKPDDSERLVTSARAVDTAVYSELARLAGMLPDATPPHAPSVRLGDSTGLSLEDNSIDFVVTSPPYCTRIDYPISTRVELAVLGYDDDRVEALRKSSMGTSSVRPPARRGRGDWGETCLGVLAAVDAHTSKSSRNYYIKTLEQYFSDLASSLAEISRVVKPGASVVLVVQDSYYKEVHVDLPAVVTQMGEALGWSSDREDRFDVPSSMRHVNSRSRKYVDRPECTEAAIWFRTR